MPTENLEMEIHLVRLCIEAACKSRESVDKWRRQRRTLERLPSPLADALLRRLLRRRLLYPSLLEVFKFSVEEIDLKGENSVDAEWMAYIGAFRYLRSLNVADCHRITSSALWAIAGMTSLKEINLSRCSKVNDAGIRHLLSISTLEKLCISETGLTANGVALLSSLKSLSVLDLGGLPVTDQALNSLQVLKKIEYLDLWGSKISNNGAAILKMFPKLSFLNLAWTDVTKLPNLPSLECLNMSDCTIESIFERNGEKSPLAKLIISGATVVNETEAFLYIETSCLSLFDASNSSLQRFSLLPYLRGLEHLDLSSSMVGDDIAELIACIGANLRNLNLSNTRISSAGVGILAGHVPNLEILSLSHTPIDDVAISYISTMHKLKVINLSNTKIRGFIHQVGPEPDWLPSLTALQGLTCLERLDLEQTQVRDAALHPLSSFQMLSHLSLESASLTDESLHHSSSLSKLINLGIRDAVLTNYGLNSYKPPATLKMLDLRGCWLLTEEAIVLFCKSYPQIEARHELVHISPSDQNVLKCSTTPRTTLKTSQVNQKQRKMSMPPSILDQRLKYSREELLALQCSSSYMASPHGEGMVLPKMSSDKFDSS